MDSYFSQMPNVRLNLNTESDELKRMVFDFVRHVERVSPYLSQVKFFVSQSQNEEYSARLEVAASSFEILLSKKNASMEALIEEFKQAYSERLKPWLEGRFSPK